MRLTLRTLLAYLDDILDTSDAEELSKKIEESEFASGLVHRIRSSSRRLRLGGPSLEGKGMGLDPNTVAEYLDNVLPPDRVPDLEKVCLESDVHLAEIASCHQILTLVLGEPAEFDPDLREHAYRIGNPDWSAQAPPDAEQDGDQAAATDEAPAPPPSDADGDAPPAPVGPPVQTVSTKDKTPLELPDYLRASQRSKLKPLAITLVLAFLLSLVALRAMGPFDDHPLMRLFGGSPGPEVTQTTPMDSVSGARQETPTSEFGSVGTLDPAGDDAASPLDTTTPGAATLTDLDPNQDPDVPKPSPAGTGEAPAKTPGTEKVPPASPSAGADAVAPTEMAKVDTNLDFPPTEPIAPKGPTMSDDAAAKPATAAVGPDGDAKPPAAPAQVDVGYVKLSDQHFVVRLDPQDGDWKRLPPRTQLASGDELRVLPTYRPEIVLTPGVQAVFSGPSSVRPLARTEQGEPGLSVEYGRVFLAEAGARIHLNLASRGCVATFDETASELAAEVRRYLPPGTHPERGQAETVVRIFTTIGRIEWQDGNAAEPTLIEAGQVRTLVGDGAQTAAAGELPAWLQHRDLREVDRVASATLETFLATDKPILLSLKERTEDRRSEVRSLAARSRAYFDSYEYLVEEFGDERQRSYWASEFDVLRDVISHSPETAARVRETFERTCGNDADDLYRLAWGYSPQQLKDGADAKLVDFLEHDSMNVRIFASENLRRITDRTHHYRPEGSDTRRKSSVRDWREELEEGTITWNSVPTPVP